MCTAVTARHKSMPMSAASCGARTPRTARICLSVRPSTSSIHSPIAFSFWSTRYTVTTFGCRTRASNRASRNTAADWSRSRRILRATSRSSAGSQATCTVPKRPWPITRRSSSGPQVLDADGSARSSEAWAADRRSVSGRSATICCAWVISERATDSVSAPAEPLSVISAGRSTESSSTAIGRLIVSARVFQRLAPGPGGKRSRAKMLNVPARSLHTTPTTPSFSAAALPASRWRASCTSRRLTSACWSSRSASTRSAKPRSRSVSPRSRSARTICRSC